MITITDARGNTVELSSDVDPASLFVQRTQPLPHGPRSPAEFFARPQCFTAKITGDLPPPRWDLSLLPAPPPGYGPGGNAHQRRRWRRWVARNTVTLRWLTAGPSSVVADGRSMTVVFHDEAPPERTAGQPADTDPR